MGKRSPQTTKSLTKRASNDLTKSKIKGMRLPKGLNKRDRRLSSIIYKSSSKTNCKEVVLRENDPLCIAQAIYCGYTEEEIAEHLNVMHFNQVMLHLNEDQKRNVLIAKIQRLTDIENVAIDEMVLEATMDIEGDNDRDLFSKLSLSKLKMENLEKILKVVQSALARFEKKADSLPKQDKTPVPTIVMSKKGAGYLPKG